MCKVGKFAIVLTFSFNYLQKHIDTHGDIYDNQEKCL